MADRIRPLKLESPASGGTELDEFPVSANPNVDHVDTRGTFLQNDTSSDEDVHVTRDASSPDNMTFKDQVQTIPVTLTQLLSATSAYQTFVFRPGGTPGLNVYTTWATLYAALSTAQGYRVLQFDNSLGVCTVPAGTYNMQDVEWRGAGSGETLVTLVEGVVLQKLRRISHWLKVDFSGTTPPITDFSGSLDFLFLTWGSTLTCSGAGPMIRKSDGGTVNGGLFLAGGVLQAGANAIIDVSVAGTAFILYYVFSSNQLGVNTVSGVMGSFLFHGIFETSAKIETGQAAFAGTMVYDYSLGQIKAGFRANASFVQTGPGQPYYADIIFFDPFPDDQYAIDLSHTCTSGRSYSLTWSNKVATGFRIELNSRNKTWLTSVDFRCQHYTSLGVT